MATYTSVAATALAPTGGPTGDVRNTFRLHDTCAVNALATNDTITFGNIPRNAVVTGATLKAQSQLDSNGSPTLTFDMGYAAAGSGAAALTASPAFWKSAVSTVGRTSGVSGDTTLATTSLLFQNTSGADLPITAKAHAGAATGVAGTLEITVDYFIEPTPGSQA